MSFEEFPERLWRTILQTDYFRLVPISIEQHRIPACTGSSNDIFGVLISHVHLLPVPQIDLSRRLDVSTSNDARQHQLSSAEDTTVRLLEANIV